MDTTVLSLQDHIRDSIVPALIVSYVVLLASAFLITYRISRPISDLTRSAEQMIAGRLPRRAPSPEPRGW